MRLAAGRVLIVAGALARRLLLRVNNPVGHPVLSDFTSLSEGSDVQLHHWLALIGGPILCVAFFAATTEKRLRGDVALVIAVVTALLIGWYLLQNNT